MFKRDPPTNLHSKIPPPMSEHMKFKIDQLYQEMGGKSSATISMGKKKTLRRVPKQQDVYGLDHL